MVVLAILYLVFLFLGAKATWKFVVNFLPSSIDDGVGLVITVIVFGVIFLIVGPIVGLVTAIKLLIKINERVFLCTKMKSPF